MDDIDLTATDAPQAPRSPNGTRKTGLTLVIPPLSAIKALKGRKKPRGLSWADVHPEGVQSPPRPPRPVKLKPLRVVLAKLIAQIKKKDDYAFFLAPVDASQVPGYADVIKQPMDFGTITKKVERGRYRTLEEFANDIRLVTTNAKTFNPPGTIYYTEAERIEAYAIDHINRAAASVIEYEGDWSIDVERDEGTPVPPDDEDKSTQDMGTPMDVDGSTRGRSPSVASTLQTPLLNAHAPRKGKSGKKQPGMSETLDPDGHLPGYKDGIGVFPPGSDWAEVMVQLKLKGKRYRTKKERLRMEKGGPPYHADGSLDYTQMEDPFSVLSVLVPDPPSKPLLTPLLPSTDPSFPGLVTLHAPRPLPGTNHLTSSTKTTSNPTRSHSRRHWTITRNAPRRTHPTHPDTDPSPPTPAPRPPHATDYGAYATLPSHLAHEYRLPPRELELGSEAQVASAIKRVVDHTIAWRHPAYADDDMDLREEGYWARRGRQAEDWMRDVVYGGVEGLAYVRSLAEFVGRRDDDGDENGGQGGEESDMEVDEYDDENMRLVEDTSLGGLSLAQYVAETIVDPLTGGRHAILRETARRLCNLPPSSPPSTTSTSTLPTTTSSTTSPSTTPSTPTPATPLVTEAHLHHALHTLPNAARTLVELRKIAAQPLDMGALLRAPEELFVADGVWAGRAFLEGRVGDETRLNPKEEEAMPLAVEERTGQEAGQERALDGAEHSKSNAHEHSIAHTNGDNDGHEAEAEAEDADEEDEEGQEKSKSALEYLEFAVRTHERAQAQARAARAVEQSAVPAGGQAAPPTAVRATPHTEHQGAPASNPNTTPNLGSNPNSWPGSAVQGAPETREMLEYALGYSADLIVELARRAAVGSANASGVGAAGNGGGMDAKTEVQVGAGAGGDVEMDDPTQPANNDHLRERGSKQDDEEEDPALRHLRLNLLALAKRAPLDKIARLPAELVPEAIRHVVPTLHG